MSQRVQVFAELIQKALTPGPEQQAANHELSVNQPSWDCLLELALSQCEEPIRFFASNALRSCPKHSLDGQTLERSCGSIVNELETNATSRLLRERLCEVLAGCAAVQDSVLQVEEQLPDEQIQVIIPRLGSLPPDVGTSISTALGPLLKGHPSMPELRRLILDYLELVCAAGGANETVFECIMAWEYGLEELHTRTTTLTSLSQSSLTLDTASEALVSVMRSQPHEPSLLILANQLVSTEVPVDEDHRRRLARVTASCASSLLQLQLPLPEMLVQRLMTFVTDPCIAVYWSPLKLVQRNLGLSEWKGRVAEVLQAVVLHLQPPNPEADEQELDNYQHAREVSVHLVQPDMLCCADIAI